METPCLEYMGPRDRYGYGRVYRLGRTFPAHRWVWMLAYGSRPPEVKILHRCDNPACFRLDHLFEGTQAENLADMAAKGRARNQKMGVTHCLQGHPYDEENTYVTPRGSRDCRICRREATRRSQQRRRA